MTNSDDVARDTLRFGVSLIPDLDIAKLRAHAQAAEEGNLDLVGVQDHPYASAFLDTFVVLGQLLAATRTISVFPDVANLPLRPPAVLAKTAAALDVVSGGRFELALGAGGYWAAIARMGVPRRSSREANHALREAIELIRALWAGDAAPVRMAGAHYSLAGVPAGPAPAHRIEIWTGAQGPNALALTGEVADGWAAPIAAYLPYEKWGEANRLIDEAAVAAGRDPASVRRIAQVVGTITTTKGRPSLADGAAPVRATAGQWAEVLARLATEQPFTSFVFWPEEETAGQITAFAREVVPETRRLLA